MSLDCVSYGKVSRKGEPVSSAQHELMLQGKVDRVKPDFDAHNNSVVLYLTAQSRVVAILLTAVRVRANRCASR